VCHHGTAPVLEYYSTFIQTKAPQFKSFRDQLGTARSVEDETRNAELNGNRNPKWWGDFSQIVKIEKIEFLGTAHKWKNRTPSATT